MDQGNPSANAARNSHKRRHSSRIQGSMPWKLPAVAAWWSALSTRVLLAVQIPHTGSIERQLRSCREGDVDHGPRTDRGDCIYVRKLGRRGGSTQRTSTWEVWPRMRQRSCPSGLYSLRRNISFVSQPMGGVVFDYHRGKSS